MNKKAEENTTLVKIIMIGSILLVIIFLSVAQIQEYVKSCEYYKKNIDINCADCLATFIEEPLCSVFTTKGQFLVPEHRLDYYKENYNVSSIICHWQNKGGVKDETKE